MHVSSSFIITRWELFKSHWMLDSKSMFPKIGLIHHKDIKSNSCVFLSREFSFISCLIFKVEVNLFVDNGRQGPSLR